MQTHLTGAIKGTRVGAAVVDQTFAIDYNFPATGTPIKLCTIVASPAQPVKLRLTGVVMTPSNAVTSHQISVGIDAGAGITAFLAAVDAKAVANTNYASAPALRILTADTDIWMQQVIVGGISAGKFLVSMELAEVNTKIATGTPE